WVKQTVQAALDFTAGGAAPARAAALAEGVLHTMYLTRIKALVLLVLVLGTLAGGVGLTLRPTQATEPAASQQGGAQANARSAVEQYPRKAYDEPAKHSGFQHVANQAAGWVWETQGVEAGEKFILDLFRKSPQFQYFYYPWWEEHYREKQQPGRARALLEK